MMNVIQVEDANNEKYHINPKQVMYVKEKVSGSSILYRIALANGESIVTKNSHGIEQIIGSMKK